MSEAEPRVSVVVATWNAGEHLAPCLESLRGQRVAGGMETIVVDNASSDESLAALRDAEADMRVVYNDHNAYYAGANNIGAGRARGEILVFLNPDTVLPTPDVVERLADVAAQPEVGIVGPRLLNPDLTLQRTCSAHLGVGQALLVGLGAHRLVPDRWRARLSPQHWSHDRAVDTGWVLGAAIAMRADLFRSLGGFWSTIYGEEQDLAYRAQQLGLRVRYEPSIELVHVGNHALGKRFPGAERLARVAAAEADFVRVHHSSARRVAFLLISATATGVRAVAHRVLGHREQAAGYAAMARTYVSALRRAG